ncbi:hypothetical protein [Zobellella sp. An-6]|uniref:hypothetical protein n=1 Tax=Zobellella sp. An-6 TaxID=3400218 RepID=UPI0040431355
MKKVLSAALVLSICFSVKAENEMPPPFTKALFYKIVEGVPQVDAFDTEVSAVEKNNKYLQEFGQEYTLNITLTAYHPLVGYILSGQQYRRVEYDKENVMMQNNFGAKFEVEVSTYEFDYVSFDALYLQPPADKARQIFEKEAIITTKKILPPTSKGGLICGKNEPTGSPTIDTPKISRISGCELVMVVDQILIDGNDYSEYIVRAGELSFIY